MKNLLSISAISSILLLSLSVHAHHSFAIYDLEQKTELKGVVTDLTVRNPHIILTVESLDEQGNAVEWRIESMNPTRWRSFEFPEVDEITNVGDEISILGWKAKNGDPEMALGTIITADDEIEIRDRIRQGQGGGMGGRHGRHGWHGLRARSRLK